ncbi:MAG: hypothetical protein DLM73_04030 [Chthoniobacterales bacterium]|nr:MAG: hypothetical protein DLM73_04030 [Chthoniobacterales bacterium]
MDFVFDIDKAVASAAYLTKRNGGETSVFVLIKKMYAAERTALATWHRPITGDSFASMKKGPVLSRTYNLIKGEVSSTNSDMVKWAKHFSPRTENTIKLISDADLDFLSAREIEALEKSAREIDALIEEKGLIADILHEKWPEWQNPADFGCGSMPLNLEDVLCEVVEDESEIERIVSEVRAVSSAKAALQVSHA